MKRSQDQAPWTRPQEDVDMDEQLEKDGADPASHVPMLNF